MASWLFFTPTQTLLDGQISSSKASADASTSSYEPNGIDGNLRYDNDEVDTNAGIQSTQQGKGKRHSMTILQWSCRLNVPYSSAVFTHDAVI